VNISKRILQLISIILFFFSCKETDRERITRLVNEWQGKEIQFPKDMVFTKYAVDTVDWQIPESDYKVLIYIDSIGCTSCKLQLDQWERLISQVDSLTKKSVSFIFIFHPKNLKELQYILRGYNFDIPIYADIDDLLNKTNKFPANNNFQTFLLDKDNKVLTVGNPVYNMAVKELYLKQIGEGILMTNKSYSIKTTAIVEFTEVNLGSFGKSENKTAEFNIQNIGDNPLVILDVATTCGCISATYDKHPVKPGNNLQIQVKISPKESGFFHEKITVKCNTDSWIKLKIKGQIS